MKKIWQQGLKIALYIKCRDKIFYKNVWRTKIKYLKVKGPKEN